MKDLRPLADHLRATHGTLAVADVPALGLDHEDVRRLVEVGLLARFTRGAYVSRTSRESFEMLAMMGVVAARQVTASPELVGAARSTAARLHGIHVPRSRPGSVHVVVPHDHKSVHSPAWIRVHRSRTLRADDVTLVDGVPVTTAERTLVDLAINLDAGTLADRIARALQLDLVTLSSLSEQLRRAGRIHGAARLRVALARIAPDTGVAESKGERVAFERLVAAGHTPVRQHPITVGSTVHRADLALVELRLAVEVNGFWWHSLPSRMAADERRREGIEDAGWEVVSVQAERVLADPDVVVRAVDRALRRRAAPPVGTAPSVAGRSVPSGR